MRDHPRIPRPRRSEQKPDAPTQPPPAKKRERRRGWNAWLEKAMLWAFFNNRFGG